MASSRTLGALQGLGQGINQVGTILLMDQLEKVRSERLMKLKESHTISAEQRAGKAAAATHARDRGETLDDAKVQREHEIGLQKMKNKAIASKHTKGYQFITQEDDMGNETIRVGNKDTGLLDEPPPKIMTSEEAKQQAEQEYSEKASWWKSDKNQFNMSEDQWKAKRTQEILNESQGKQPTMIDPKRVQEVQARLAKKGKQQAPTKAGATGKPEPSRSQKREKGFERQRQTVAEVAKTDLSKMSAEQLNRLSKKLKDSAHGVAGMLSPEVRKQLKRIFDARQALED